MDFLRVIKTITPAVAVMLAGLFGVNYVYNNYLNDGAASVISVEPAAGETTVTIEDTAIVTEDGNVVVTTETVTETVTEHLPVTEGDVATDVQQDAVDAAVEKLDEAVEATQDAAEGVVEAIEAQENAAE